MQDVETVGCRTNGRKSAAQRQRSPRHSSPVSFVVMAMATWSCSGASSRHCNTASSRRCSTVSSQHYNAAAHIAAVLRRFIMLQLTSRLCCGAL
ncbi:unnamed protein product [Sphagnum jensenii]|uniref:Secreted protein n=1 Tax=Sphagnum jensenii TaxID=128206 RepID=A0ABP0WZ78_9BRYO